MPTKRFSHKSIQGEHVATNPVAVTHKRNDALPETNDIWRLVGDAASEAIIAIRENGTVILWNETAASMFGWRSDEVDGKVFVELVLPKAHRKEIASYMEKYLETEDDRIFDRRIEIYGLAKDGREFPIELSIVPRRRSDGHTFVAFVRDVTEQKAQNDRIKQAQKMEAIGMLAGGMAHEFNNILSAIGGNLVLARADVPDDHPILESLSEIEKATSRAAYVVKQILTFSTYKQSGTGVIDLEQALQEAVKLLRATVPSTMAIELICEPDLPSVLADSIEIHQIVLNLGINAQQSMSYQTGRFRIQADQQTLDESDAERLGVQPGSFVRISAGDTGCGMDRQTLEKAFEPFFTTKAVGEGTGLGLSIVYGIVAHYRGAVTVDSEVGKGTVFNIYLPAVDKVAPPPASGKSQGAHTGNMERILYVDDDESLVYMLTRILQRLNYQVFGFSDSREALASFHSNPDGFDLIITDLSMPHLDGATLVREIQAIRPDLPIVLVTGYIRPKDLELAESLAVSKLILKPNTATEMGEVLHGIFEEKLAKAPQTT